jgi:ElaB/YqjD/DUF883 family membrane-anchored ribosome-binding protein
MATQTKKSSNTDNANAEGVTMSEALDQVKQASSSMYDAVGSIGSAGAANARLKAEEGKAYAREYGSRAEDFLRERPLMTVGAAFAAGWLVSRLLKPASKE